MKGALPPKGDDGEAKIYRVVYAVHMVVDPTSDTAKENPESTQQANNTTRFIGLVALTSVDADNLALPEDLTLPATATTTTLSMELGYQFLPIGWGKGYATESVNAVIEACKRAWSFWTPFSKVYVRAIVNRENPASLRVMSKTGMMERGVYEWSGKPIFLAGEWTERSTLHIFGLHLLGGEE